MGDFNNDNLNDLVIGAPGASPEDASQSGAIFTLNGSTNGLIAGRDFNQDSLDLGSNELGDNFGLALAIGNFNNDDFDDLVVGAPGESPGNDPQSGAIFTLNGSTNGLVAGSDFTQENLDLGSNELGDAFGRTLVTGDFNNDDFDDLVVGAPRKSPGEDPQSGAIFTLNGSTNGLVAGSDFNQENLNLGTNELGDNFGLALATGDFDNDSFDDLVVGAPEKSPGNDPRSGAVFTLNGSSNGLVAGSDFNQESLDLGTNDLGDAFGSALAVGDFNNDGFDDLVVGAPGESPGNDPQSGAIYTLNGSSDGLVAGSDFNQENLELGTNDLGDAFGSALAVGDFNNDGFDDLVVGAPLEGPGNDPQSGEIYLLRGSINGLTGDRSFNQESLDLGTNELGDLFGSSLTVGDFNNDGFEDLGVGAPGESPGEDPRSGAIYTLLGSSSGLVAGNNLNRESLGLGTNEAGDSFGSTLASDRLEDTSEPIITPPPLPEGQTGLYRFRNNSFSPGTYIFVGLEERDRILSDSDLSSTFILEGGGNRAFVASNQPGDNLIPLYRLRNVDLEGTYLFVSTEEYNAIFAEDSNQRNKWIKEGLDAEGGDIAEFYVYGVGANLGAPFNRFQNKANNTFLFAGTEETDAINNDPNLSGIFIDQGSAFESL